MQVSKHLQPATHTLKMAALNQVTIIIHTSPQSRIKGKKDQFYRGEKHKKGEGLVPPTQI